MLQFISHEPRVPGQRKILIASDLSCRCDRALARAGHLAKDWNAWLIATHVVARAGVRTPTALVPSWRRPEDPRSLAELQLRGDVAEACTNAAVMVVDGDPPREILKIASRHAVDLIVTGLTGAILGGMRFGGTLKSLARGASVPILVVKRKARRPYARIVVPVDFTVEDACALTTVARLFPEAQFTLFHAFTLPGPGLAFTEDHVEPLRRQAQRALAEFAIENVPAGAVLAGLRMVAECGDLQPLLADFVQAEGADLVALGVPSRRTFAELLAGSFTHRLIRSMPCDLLIARDPRVKE